METKDDLLDQAAREFRALHDALRGLNEGDLTRVWLGAWSTKDIVVHISGWHREMIPALERLARGERPIPEGVSYDDVDAWNAKFVVARRNATVADAVLELDRSHEDFMRAAAAVPAERFVPGKTAWRIVDLNSAHHYREHGHQIRSWRERQGL
ncbi:MAG: ClbS/DfsB family four-helix bundle protein [Candidatus Rokubacteria bacterium]|nr:ClbS/DfsB family four-helix bundle protein [Candidatus Rokubacteria bacterium]